MSSSSDSLPLAAAITSAITSLIAIASLFWSIRVSVNQREQNAIIYNLTAISGVEGKIAQIPTVLRFHGIDVKELQDKGVTLEEFAYLVSSFSIGGAYYRASPRPEKLLQPGSYRYEMCRAEATQEVWSLLRKMIAPSPYRDHLDEIVKDLKMKRREQGMGS